MDNNGDSTATASAAATDSLDNITTTDDNDLTTSLLSPETGRVPGNSNNNNNSHNNVREDFVDAEERERQFSRTRRIMRRIGERLAYGTLFTMLCVVPMILYRALSIRALDLAAWRSAKVMVLGVTILSGRQVYLHLTHWYMPEVQKYVVRILFMVPIYAAQSWLSLRFHYARIYIGAVRDLYEAYVIASFVYYLIALLGGEDGVVSILERKAADTSGGHKIGQHTFPFNLFMEPWDTGLEYMLQCKHGALQYVVFKVCSTVLMYFFESLGIYGEGQFNWLVAYPYLCFMQNLSIMYALYCLVMLYHACEEELRHPVDWHPLGKFLCVKGVVFFTWWQGVLIYYLKDHGIITKMGSWTSKEVANGLIDYCVVLEMVGFAIAHSFTFTHTEYLPHTIPEQFRRQSSLNEINDNNSSEENNNHEHDRGNNISDDDPDTSFISNGSYVPPATLDRPMRFKDALWSSAVPEETLSDISKLRKEGISVFNNISIKDEDLPFIRRITRRGTTDQQQQQQNDDTDATTNDEGASLPLFRRITGRGITDQQQQQQNNDTDSSTNSQHEQP